MWVGVFECGVSAASVVEHFDVLKDRVRQLDPGLPLPTVQQFDLHRRPEGFHHGIVEAVADGAERGHEPGGADAVA